MEFARRPPRPRGESIVPMINVVFLLLIFFLMTAQIAPPEPFAISVPEAEADQAADSPDTLFVDAEGALAYGALRGDAVFGAIALRGGDAPLLLRADAGLAGAALAALLPRLAEAGATDVLLITGAP